MHSASQPISIVGKPAKQAAVTQVIQVVAADDMRFYFSSDKTLHEGDVVQFDVINAGKVTHEFSIGSEKEQQAHLKMMRKMPDMVHHHGNAITLKPGEQKSLIWQFKAGDEAVFACNIPGHFEAGMYKKIPIAARP